MALVAFFRWSLSWYLQRLRVDAPNCLASILWQTGDLMDFVFLYPVHHGTERPGEMFFG